MTLFRIALRNVLKNRRRSLITVLAIAFGFMAVAMFKGYVHQAYEKISLAVVFREIPGHLAVFKEGFLSEGRIRPESFLFTADEAAALTEVILRMPEVLWVGEKLELTGLISNGDVSTIFLSDALDPAKEEELLGHYGYRQIPERSPLPVDRPDAILVGDGLMDLLKLRPEDGVVLMTTTQHGQMNAADATVVGTRATFSDELSDKYAKLPLGLAKDLYDVSGCDRLCVLTTRFSDLHPIRERLREAASGLGMAVEIKTWDELSQYYQKAKDFLDVVFFFLFCITGIIVVMGTVNTMSMAVYERTREIGTLRAIGLKPRGVLALFSLEGAILGIFGGLAGLGLTALGRLAVAAAQITYRPPGVGEDILIEVDLVPEVLLVSGVSFVLLSISAAVLPARRAARQPIVDALGHV